MKKDGGKKKLLTMSYKPKERYASSNNTDNDQADISRSLNLDYLFQAKSIIDFDEKNSPELVKQKYNSGKAIEVTSEN